MFSVALSMLLACGGESVTFEEPEPVEEAVEDEAGPEGSADEDYQPVTTPEDGREEIEANAEEGGGRQPASRDVWPPIVVPEDQREREWEWEFEYKGPTKKAGVKSNPSREEMRDMERIRRGE